MKSKMMRELRERYKRRKDFTEEEWKERVEGEGERGVAIESEIRVGSCAYRKRARDKS